MTREEAVNELSDKIKSAEYVDSDYIDCVSVDAVKMAISALIVPETNVGDTISRQAAIDALRKDVMGGLNYESILKRLPSAEPEREWITCSERLPEKYQTVLTTIKGVDLFLACADKNFFEALATAKKRTWVSVGILGEYGWYRFDGYQMTAEPIAWMPLPEPYNGDTQP